MKDTNFKSLNFFKPSLLRIFCCFFIVLLVFSTSCNKDSGADTVSIEKSKEGIITNSLKTREFVGNDPYLELTMKYFNDYRGTDPRTLFPTELYDTIVARIELELVTIENIGFDNYVNDLHSNGTMNVETKNLFIHLHNSAVTPDTMDLEILSQELVDLYAPAKVSMTGDPFYNYLYNLVLGLYEDYFNEENAQNRGECEIKAFFEHAWDFIVAGFAAGAWLGANIEGGEGFFGQAVEVFGFVIGTVGGFIGAGIGAVVAIFTFDVGDQCDDCSDVDGVAITSDDDCDLTRTLFAFGAGDDALMFTWDITQNNSTVRTVTPTAFITVTQLSATEPIGVSAASTCSQDGTPTLGTFTPTQNIDLSTSATGDQGQVGVITLTYTCPFENQWGDYVSNCFDHEAPVLLTFNTSNELTGHIEYSGELTPSNAGTLGMNENSAVIDWDWNFTGSATFTLTATNVCSGLTASASQTMTVTN